MTETQQKKVLIVEDEATSQEILKKLVAKIGAEVSIATNAEEAFASLSAAHYDLIVMDLKLEGLSGIDITKSIREKERNTNNHVLIVAVTSMESAEDKKRCMDAGMDGYFKKPLDRLRFLGVLQGLLSK